MLKDHGIATNTIPDAVYRILDVTLYCYINILVCPYARNTRNIEDKKGIHVHFCSELGTWEPETGLS